MAENNQSRNPEIQYIRVLKMPHGSLDMEKAEHNYDPEIGAGEGLLLHAGAVPAVQESALREGLSGPRDLAGDGRHHGDRLRLVHRLPLLRGRLSLLGAAVQFHQAVDSERAAQSGHGLPRQPSAAPGRDGEMPLLRPAHARGRYPACLEVCPTGARKFGNILDPNSEVSYILRTKRVFIQLKEELGTSPRFFYYFDV